MKKLFTKWLSALLAAMLLLSPVALMEEAAPEAEWTEPVIEAEPVDVEIEEVGAESVDDAVEETDAALVEETEVELVADETEPSFGVEGSIEINEANFPDPGLREALGKSWRDTDQNGVLDPAEISEIKQLYFDKNEISDLTGIGLLSALEDLEIRANNITTLDVSQNTNLKSLRVVDNALTGLDVTKNIALTSLDVRSNAIEALDLSQNTLLVGLRCDDNALESLDVSKNTLLEALSCGGNPLTTLDVSANTALTDLICHENRLTELDVRNNTKLKRLYCEKNQIEALYLPQLPDLETLECYSNKLTSLDVTQSPKLEDLFCYDNKLTSLDVSGNPDLWMLECYHNNIATLDITMLKTIMPYVCNAYKRKEADGAVYYSSMYEYGEDWEDMYGAVLAVDIATKLPGTIAESEAQVVPAVPETPAVPAAPAAPVTPTIAALKKSVKATLTAAPGTAYQIDLGGQTGKSFKSSNKKIATVTPTGLVTMKKAGKVKITYKVGKQKRSLTLKFVDSTIPKSVSLNLSGTIAVAKGDVVTLVPTIPEGTNSGFKWKTSNKKVATVKNGVVTFKKAGTVTITVTASRGKKKAKVKFKVSK